jgi:hypothetical protein
MSVTILKDVEESLLREFRNILIAEQRTQTYESFPSSFDPFTGEKIEGQSLEAHFLDSSANGRNIEYPHVFIKILRSEEDLSSGRIVPPYGKEVSIPIAYAPRAYNVILSSEDFLMTSGNTVSTNNLKSILINNTYTLNIISGPNVGTYFITGITLNGNGPHTITLSSTIVPVLPANNYRLSNGTVTFLSPIDLNTVAAGDIFTDSTSKIYTVQSVDVANNAIIIDKHNRHNPPSPGNGSSITRPGNVLPTSDLITQRRGLVLDPSSPIVGKGLLNPNLPNTGMNEAHDWAIPLDLIFGITIDTKTFNDHTAVWNRVWEEFNPPRRGLPIVVRTKRSSESLLARNFSGDSSNEIEVYDSSTFIVGEYVQVFNKFIVGFNTQILDINYNTNTLMLADPVPNSFTTANDTRIVSNVSTVVWEWDFQSHRDNSTDGSQYWSHSYEYRVQVWVDKKFGQEIYGVIKQIDGDIEPLGSDVIINSIKVP